MVSEHVLAKTKRVILWGRNELRTLSSDGVKNRDRHYDQFTIGLHGKCVYKDAVHRTLPNTKEVHYQQFCAQLMKDIEQGEAALAAEAADAAAPTRTASEPEQQRDKQWLSRMPSFFRKR